MNSTIHVTTDSKVKKQAQKIAKEMGLNLSVVVNNLLKNFIKEQSIEFVVEKKLPEDLEESIISNLEDSKNEPRFSDPDALIDYSLNN